MSGPVPHHGSGGRTGGGSRGGSGVHGGLGNRWLRPGGLGRSRRLGSTSSLRMRLNSDMSAHLFGGHPGRERCVSFHTGSARIVCYT